eukprot:267093_1
MISPGKSANTTENTTYLQMEQNQAPQPQVLVVSQPDSMRSAGVGNQLLMNENAMLAFTDLTVCHWLACLFCNCCGCALIGFILNQFVNAARNAGNHRLAFFTHKTAKNWMITACVCTAIPWVILLIIWFGGMLTVDHIRDQLNGMMGSGVSDSDTSDTLGLGGD